MDVDVMQFKRSFDHFNRISLESLLRTRVKLYKCLEARVILSHIKTVWEITEEYVKNLFFRPKIWFDFIAFIQILKSLSISVIFHYLPLQITKSHSIQKENNRFVCKSCVGRLPTLDLVCQNLSKNMGVKGAPCF